MTEKKLKILHLVQRYHPDVGGMEEVVKQISENLVILGHEVHVASSASKLNIPSEDRENGVHIRRFAISGNSVLGIKGEVEKFKKFLRTDEFDVITVFAAQQWACDLFMQEIEKFKCATVFVPTGFSGLRNYLYKNYFQMMANKIKFFDSTILHSKSYQDYHFAKDHEAQNIVVIPNGASEKEFENVSDDLKIAEKLGVKKDDFVVISIGNHTGLKGHDEAIQIFKKSSLPKNSKLFIVGKSFFPNPCHLKCKIKSWINNLSFSKKIFVLDLERKDLVHLLKRADIMLFPSNIECAPIVITEALVSSTFYLASNVGNIKEMNEQYGGGKILPSYELDTGFITVKIDESAKILSDCAQEILRTKRQLQTQNPLLLELSWKTITKQYLKTYINAMSHKNFK